MPLVIPIFIPHEGCPHCCSFCNQRRISGYESAQPVRAADVAAIIEQWLDRERERAGRTAQVAFYGGSFTGLPRERQVELLGAVTPFLRSGAVSSIRLSTRPDYIDEQICDFLRASGVSLVELGVQSLDDRVLRLAGRGHTAEQAKQAIKQLRAAGLEVGAQLMIGLPGETRVSLMRTTKQIIALRPDCVRIYPVLVLRGSGLGDMLAQGRYHPLSLQGAVLRAAWMKKHFDEHNITVLRMGLQAGRELENALIAGPYHPAFGEMVNARLMLCRTRKLLTRLRPGHKAVLTISPRDQSVFRGIQSVNMKRLAALGLLERFVLQTEAEQSRFSVNLKE